MKWLGMKDQELFQQITIQQFNVFITNDKNLIFQINYNYLSFSIVDLNFFSNRYEDLLTIIPPINKELQKLELIKNKIYIFNNSVFEVWR